MRIWKIIMITSLLGAVGMSSFGCASESDSESLLENQAVTVQRGDLVIDTQQEQGTVVKATVLVNVERSML